MKLTTISTILLSLSLTSLAAAAEDVQSTSSTESYADIPPVVLP